MALLIAALLTGCSAGGPQAPTARDDCFTLSVDALQIDRDGGLHVLASATYTGPEGAPMAYGDPAIQIELLGADGQPPAGYRRTHTGAGRQGVMTPGDRLVSTDGFPKFAGEPAPPPGTYEVVYLLDYTLIEPGRSARLTLRAPVTLP